ncbi:MAG: DUF4442 domain-containing protein [Bacteroidetes bacterium]|nr:DUF4442 domain-containing protein [Bacteroidota bacterium]
MTPHTDSFIALAKHPFKFRVFLFYKLPSAFFSGVRVKDIDTNKCVVTVPYKWFSQNPFRSTYFACLSMAAEMSTGLLSLAHAHKNKPDISMLVTKVDSSYFKKATGITTFVCEDGQLISETIAKAVTTGEGHSIIAKSIGKNDTGELVAEFFITWSFKVKKSTYPVSGRRA